MNQKSWIPVLVILVVILVGTLAIKATNVNNGTPNDNNKPIDNPTNAFVSQSVNTLVWPDVNSFNLTNKTFNAEELNSRKTISVATNSYTKFYKIVYEKPTAGDYFDFQGLYSLMKEWVGPTWRFTLKGTTQSDGSILADEIFYTIQ